MSDYSSLSAQLLPGDVTTDWSSTSSAYLNTFKSILGTGLLAMPAAFLSVGIPCGCLLASICGAWSIYTMQLIAWCVDAAPTRPASYAELVVAAMGESVGVLSTVNLLVNQIVCCATYLVFIGDNLQQILGIPSATIILLTAPFFTLLCWFRDITLLG